MKISKKFPNIREENALVLVTGKQDAVIYSINHGLMERIDAFKIPNPKYSDNEGHFGVGRRGRTLSSGSMGGEIKNKDAYAEFLRELKKRLKNLPADFEKLYLFVPSPYKKEVKEALPVEWRKKIAGEVMGNYYYRSPENLLQKLEEPGEA